MTEKIRFGCIADDFTGASDAASFLRAGGAATLLVNGVPEEGWRLPGAADAVVLALKTRSIAAEDAVTQSMAGLRWLQNAGARQLYIKYCSTFDSTPKGNIGPVCDAALEAFAVPYTVLCPALPVNGRTVKDGVLYVNGVPLAETHMRHHPLNPMQDSDIAVLMRPQSRYDCMVPGDEALASEGEMQRMLAAFAVGRPHFYVIPNQEDEADAARILARFGQLPLLTGGSGLMELLGERHKSSGRLGFLLQPPKPRALILAGSCSQATQGQVRYYLQNGGQGVLLHEEALAGEDAADILWRQVEAAAADVLVYTAGSAGQREETPADEQVARRLEDTLASVAKTAVQNGFGRIIVAGGETSGAVTKALGYSAYYIAQSVAPGVPVMAPAEAADVRLVLKSGNFGQEDFFARALELTAQSV